MAPRWWQSYHGIVIDELTLEHHAQSAHRESPFLPAVAGFNEEWWVWSWLESGGSRGDALSIWRADVEVARAMLLPHKPHAAHVGAETLVRPVELARFEVVAHERFIGVGRSAIDLVAAHYSGQDLWVHSDADGFYERSGWKKHQRVDGEVSFASFFTRMSG